MKYPAAVQNFVDFYNEFSVENPSVFNKVYGESVVFQDPFHRIEGRPALYSYFQGMMRQVLKCEFNILDIHLGDLPAGEPGAASVIWDMTLQHKALNRGKEFVVNGSTLIQFDGQVILHRDFFDSSQLIYKNIPVIKSFVRLIEKGMAVE